MTSNLYNVIGVLVCLGGAILCLSIVFNEYNLIMLEYYVKEFEEACK